MAGFFVADRRLPMQVRQRGRQNGCGRVAGRAEAGAGEGEAGRSVQAEPGHEPVALSPNSRVRRAND